MAPGSTLRRPGAACASAVALGLTISILGACSKTNKVKTDAPQQGKTCIDACQNVLKAGLSEQNAWCGRHIQGRIEDGVLVKGSDSQECVERCEDEGASDAAITCVSKQGTKCVVINGCEFLQ